MCHACLQLDSAALQAALKATLEEQQQDLQLQPVVQLFVKDGARGWVKVPPSGQGGSGKGGGFRCPSSQGIAAQLAQVSFLSWPAGSCSDPLGCVEPSTSGCCPTCLAACLAACLPTHSAPHAAAVCWRRAPLGTVRL
jgi:hypothetical protein